MKKLGHIQQYELTLIAKSPIHVGNSKEIHKKEYLTNKQKGTVTVINSQKLMNYVIQNKLIDKYEKFMLSSEPLFSFIKENNIDVKKIEEYATNVGDALRVSKISIKQCMRDKDNTPFIPGSSIKGALRTAILLSILKPVKDAERILENKGGIKDIENHFFHTLDLTNKKNDAVNSIMKGISISDSKPIDKNNIILCAKIDAGVEGKTKRINSLRESLKPGTKIETTITIDTRIANIEMVEDAIKMYMPFYKNTYKNKFTSPLNVERIDTSDCIYLGGGAGFFSKTVVYKLMPYDKALDFVSKNLQRIFKKQEDKHKHKEDKEKGISPHTLKYTQYNGKLWEMGLCKIEIK